MLFAFCGQTLAAPFLACCLEIDKATANLGKEHCATMSMESNEHQTDTETSNHAMTSISMDGHVCEQQCNFCVMSTIVVPDVEDSQHVVKSTHKFIFYQSILPSSYPGNPFRPPIIT